MDLFEHTPILKRGDVKIESSDLVSLFSMLENYQYIICNNLEILNEDEKNELNKSIYIYDKLKAKYILIADYRRQEHLWFEILKMIDNGEYEKYVGEEDNNSYSLEEYVKTIEYLVKKHQELTPNMRVLIGMLIKLFSFDEVRRSIWGHYMEAKSERERLKNLIETSSR